MTSPSKLLVKSIDNSALILIGLFSLLYDQFSRNFAELNIQLPFLNFPIFIGEILLAFCLGLAVYKFRIDTLRPRLGQWRYWISGFIFFILAKALYGYIQWGPMALRDSALFYYSLFFILASYFYRRDLFNKNVTIFLIAVFLLRLALQKSFIYSIVTWISLTFILIKSYPVKKIRTFLFILLLICIPYEFLFENARMMMVGHIAACIYLLMAIFFHLPLKLKTRSIICVCLLALLVVGFFTFAPKERIGSIADLKMSWTLYKVRDQLISEQKKDYRMMELPHVLLYNSESDPRPIQLRRAETDTALEIKRIRNEKENNVFSYKKGDTANKVGNGVFRLLIWRDMWDNLVAEKPIFGFDFGKPFRSISLEILNLGSGEWGRDGWIAAHNSYLSMVYRAGLVGVLFVVLIIYAWFKMAASFIRLKSITGILLCASLLTYLVAANFGLIFELPYTAIPVWSLFGVTFRYWQEKLCNEGKSG